MRIGSWLSKDWNNSWRLRPSLCSKYYEYDLVECHAVLNLQELASDILAGIQPGMGVRFRELPPIPFSIQSSHYLDPTPNLLFLHTPNSPISQTATLIHSTHATVHLQTYHDDSEYVASRWAISSAMVRASTSYPSSERCTRSHVHKRQ